MSLRHVQLQGNHQIRARKPQELVENVYTEMIERSIICDGWSVFATEGYSIFFALSQTENVNYQRIKRHSEYSATVELRGLVRFDYNAHFRRYGSVKLTRSTIGNHC